MLLRNFKISSYHCCVRYVVRPYVLAGGHNKHDIILAIFRKNVLIIFTAITTFRINVVASTTSYYVLLVQAVRGSSGRQW